MDSVHHVHIGMRKIKTLLTILIGFLLWQIPRLFIPGLEVHPLFTYAYGILEIRDTSEHTKTYSIQRLKANAVAFSVALLIMPLRVFMHSQVADETLLIFLDLAMILVGILIALTGVEILRCGSMSGLAAVYFTILLIFYNGNPYIYALIRACQTLLGVAVAWLVNVVLLPYPSRKKEKEQKHECV